MGIAPSVLYGTVMHKRLFPKLNAFSYGIYYLCLPLAQLGDLPLAVDRFGIVSFHRADHGRRDGSCLEAWARNMLNEYALSEADGEIVLVAMPRVLGYVFNPVSCWLCHDRQQRIRAVICEVSNTFGERHCYLCAHPDRREITRDDVLSGEKVFHVSPFLPREGNYRFRFDIGTKALGVWINYHDAQGAKQLVASLRGELAPLDARSLKKAFFGYPLVTFKAILLIHWQALKLFARGVKHFARPSQKRERTSATRKVKKA